MSSGHSIKELLSPSNTWAGYTLYGESIPHLLHWDLAYLWILQREENTRPSGWMAKVEAWRRLLCMLLLNELQLETKPIPQPLLTYTQPSGITKLTVVRATTTSFGQKVIGVISPTVIVRPLPQPNRFGITDEELSNTLPAYYQPNPHAVDRRQQLDQVLEYAANTLRQSGSRLASSLESILQRELSLGLTRSQQRFPVTSLASPVPLLYAADASAWDNPSFVDIELMVAQGSTGRRLEFVPKCSHCGKNVTFPELAQPIIVSESISISCPACSASNIFPLESFGIFREGPSVYVWRELQQFSELGEVQIPPSPRVDGNEVLFRWNPGMLDGNSASTVLRLRFPDANVIAVTPQEIKYDRLLVPGELESFRGNPIRPEWLFAVVTPPSCSATGDVLNFRNMRVKGLKFAVSIPSYPRAACRILPDLQLGLYPKPLYPRWRRYRIFWSTASRDARFTARIVKNDSARSVSQPTETGVADWNDEVPFAVSLQETTVGQLNVNGATWLMPSCLAESTNAQPIYIGVDFGTTTSIVYFEKEEGSQQALVVDDILETAYVVAGGGSARCGFLPLPGSDVDRSFLPSALWFSSADTYNPIRWTTVEPSPDYRAVHGFKWGAGEGVLRRRYLEELLFLCLPAALGQAFPYGGINPNWKIGFAFPLAFSDPQRMEYVRIFKDVRQQVQDYAGGNPAIFTINESFACVRAFGEHGFGEVFLIADLGGGSLDVALFELTRGEDGQGKLKEFQVGSAKIGGEVFVLALAKGIGLDQRTRETEYWNIRDAILTQSTSTVYGGSEAKFATVANRFLPIGLELLRVMAAAFTASAPDKSIQVVFVGNGWKIAEYQTGVQRAAQVARKELERCLSLFDIPALIPYPGRLEYSPKHLVAIGALQNAKPGGRNELEEEAHQSRLPAGRNIRIRLGAAMIQWSNLVGTAEQNLSPGLQTADLDFERDYCPPAPAQWRERLDFALPALEKDPSTAVIRSRMNVVGCGLDKGPLQVMLEKRAEDLP